MSAVGMISTAFAASPFLPLPWSRQDWALLRFVEPVESQSNGKEDENYQKLLDGRHEYKDENRPIGADKVALMNEYHQDLI